MYYVESCLLCVLIALLTTGRYTHTYSILNRPHTEPEIKSTKTFSSEANSWIHILLAMYKHIQWCPWVGAFTSNKCTAFLRIHTGFFLWSPFCCVGTRYAGVHYYFVCAQCEQAKKKTKKKKHTTAHNAYDAIVGDARTRFGWIVVVLLASEFHGIAFGRCCAVCCARFIVYVCVRPRVFCSVRSPKYQHLHTKTILRTEQAQCQRRTHWFRANKWNTWRTAASSMPLLLSEKCEWCTHNARACVRAESQNEIEKVKMDAQRIPIRHSHLCLSGYIAYAKYTAYMCGRTTNDYTNKYTCVQPYSATQRNIHIYTQHTRTFVTRTGLLRGQYNLQHPPTHERDWGT